MPYGSRHPFRKLYEAGVLDNLRLLGPLMGRSWPPACYRVNVQLAEWIWVLTVFRPESAPLRPEAQHGSFRPLETAYCVLELPFWVTLQQDRISTA